eukprot:g9761.t1 g9761   contig4:517351-517780(+)
MESYEDAIESYKESHRMMTVWYGLDHMSLSEILNEIGATQFKQDEYSVAKDSFIEALRIMRLAPNNINKSSIHPTLSHLGHALYKNHELDLAAEAYLESFNVQVSIVTGGKGRG